MTRRARPNRNKRSAVALGAVQESPWHTYCVGVNPVGCLFASGYSAEALGGRWAERVFAPTTISSDGGTGLCYGI